MSISLDTPDENFRLDAAERAKINPMYDPDALERLLQLVHPDHEELAWCVTTTRRLYACPYQQAGAMLYAVTWLTRRK